jgi:O-antigen/teichoic acid export membrane protein
MDRRLPYFSAKRIAGTFTAEAYSQAVVLAVQLVQLPVLLLAWGRDIYGEWLILSASALYLTVADLGYTHSAKNAMAIRAAAGDKEGALSVYQSVFVLLAVIGGTTLSLTACLVLVLPINRGLNIHALAPSETHAIIILLATGVLLHHFLMLQVAGVRCVGRPGLEITWVATTRLVEVGSLCGVAAAGGTPVASATASLAARILSSIILEFWLRRSAPWLKLGPGSASLREVKALLHPSFGFMLMPLSHTLLTQGPVLVLATFGSSGYVVLYSASRTLARLGMAGMNAVNSSFIAEYTFSLAEPSVRVFKSLARCHAAVMAGVVVLYSAAMYLFGAPLMYILAAGKLAPSPPLMAVLVAGVVLEMVWSAGVAPLTVLGRHASFAYALAILSIASVLLAIPATDILGVTGPAWSAIPVHAVLVAIVAFQLSRLRSISPRWTVPEQGWR